VILDVEPAELRELYHDLLADVLGEHEVLALVGDPVVPGDVAGTRTSVSPCRMDGRRCSFLGATAIGWTSCSDSS
jgi:hypothetical protein